MSDGVSDGSEEGGGGSDASEGDDGMVLDDSEGAEVVTP